MSHLKSAISCAGVALLLSSSTMASDNNKFNYVVDRFADIEVLRYKVPGFENLSLNQKKLIYYLTEAALWGRDILTDQNFAHNLEIRQLLENVYTNYDGDRNDPEFKAFEKYLKQVWFGNGIHHHYSTDQFIADFSPEFLKARIQKLPEALRPKNNDLVDIICAKGDKLTKRVNQAEGQDLIKTSANNLYDNNVTQAEVEAY
jgi:dipeptidyl-peptidase-3